MTMRIFLILLASTSLAACGGAGVQTAGSASTLNNSGAAAGAPVPSSGHTFVAPTEVKTYSAIGGVQSYTFSNNEKAPAVGQTFAGSPDQQYLQLYAANASTARNSAITVTYNPRDAIFDVLIKDKANFLDDTLRFQDPAHRTNFGGDRQPQVGVPDLSTQGVQYLQAGGSNVAAKFDPAKSDIVPEGPLDLFYDVNTFFYQKPGTTTKFVTFAGFVRNRSNVFFFSPPVIRAGESPYRQFDNIFERGAFVFGERTSASAVPKIGSGTFTGPMIATMIYNPLLDANRKTPSYFQWINGSATTTVNFAANTFNIDLSGKVTEPQFDIYTSKVYTLLAGADFFAKGSGRIDLVNAGGFLGSVSSAYFVQPGTTDHLDVNVAGSSVDGTFFGPTAEEVGGGFRIVGGTPDQRIDILGAFTGKK
jgi:hypothetical protein